MTKEALQNIIWLNSTNAKLTHIMDCVQQYLASCSSDLLQRAEKAQGDAVYWKLEAHAKHNKIEQLQEELAEAKDCIKSLTRGHST